MVHGESTLGNSWTTVGCPEIHCQVLTSLPRSGGVRAVPIIPERTRDIQGQNIPFPDEGRSSQQARLQLKQRKEGDTKGYRKGKRRT